MLLLIILSIIVACKPGGPPIEPEETQESADVSEEVGDELDELSEQYRVTENSETVTETETTDETRSATETAPTVAPKPTPVPTPTKPPAPTKPPVQWTALVNKTLNYVLISRDGEPYRAFICSVGDTTPTGTFHTTDKYTWRALFGDVWGQYATRIVNNILFHSVPYLTANPDALETDEYNKLGSTASAGCVRMTVAGCKWIFDNCPRGMEVVITSESIPCPIGIEGAVKIPLDCTWDPTDPNPRNPWKGYSGETPETSPSEPETPIESTPESSETESEPASSEAPPETSETPVPETSNPETPPEL